MGLSNQSEQDFLNDWFVPAAPAYNPPATHYISLHDGDPADTGANEITGGSYGRFLVAAPATFWAAAAGRLIQNTLEAIFSDMPAVTVSHCGIWDALTLGNYMGGDALQTSRTFSAGDTATFEVGSLRIRMVTTDLYSDYAVHGWLNRQFRVQSLTRPTSHTLSIYDGDPYAAGAPIAGSTPQAIAFSGPAPNGTRHECTQNNGDIVFSTLTGGDTLDHWLVRDHLANDIIRRNQASQSPGAGDSIKFDDGTIVVGVD